MHFTPVPTIYSGLNRKKVLTNTIYSVCKSQVHTPKNKYSNIPWSKISGMRNKLIHEYFGVDLETLWNTIKNRLPEIKTSIEEILKNLDTEI